MRGVPTFPLPPRVPSVAPAPSSPRGRFRRFPFRRDRETAADVRYGVAANERRAREDHDANRSDIVSLSRFVRTNPLGSLTRERPFPSYTRAFFNTIPRKRHPVLCAIVARPRSALGIRARRERDGRARPHASVRRVLQRRRALRSARAGAEQRRHRQLHQRRRQTRAVRGGGGGDEHVVELVIKAGAALEKKDRQGRSPLWAACYHLRPSAVARLLCLGADPSARDGDGTTPLIAAAAAEGGGGERNARGEKRAALEQRARETVTAALTFSDPDALDLEHREWLTGCTALWAACASGSVGVALELIAAGADVDAKTRTAGRRCARRSADTARSRWRWWRPAPTSTPPTTRARRRCTRRRSRTTRRRSPRWSPRARTSTGASRRRNRPETKPVLSTREDSRRTGTTLKKNGETRKTTPRRETFHHAKRVSSVSRPKKKKRRLRNASQGVIRRWWVRAGAATPRRSRPCSRTAGRRPDLERVTSDGRTALAASCWRGNHACARACCWQRAPRWTMRTRTGARRCGPPRAPATPPPCACASSAGVTSTGRTARREAFSAGAGVATCTPVRGVAGGARRRARASGRRRGPTRRRRRGPRAAQPRRPGQRGPHREHAAHPRDAAGRGREGGEERESRRRGLAPGRGRRTARTRSQRWRATRAARLERADAQARVAAAWVEKREARARAAALPAQDDLSDDDFGDSKTPKRPIRRLMTRRLVRRARPSCRRRVALGARRVARALAAFRDAPRAARDAERRSTVTLRPADVAGADAAAAPEGAPPNAASLKQKQSGKRARLLRALGAPGTKGTKLCLPRRFLSGRARGRGSRRRAARATRARAREIRSSLADLPDALARLDERAAPLAALERGGSSGKPSVAARLSAAGVSPRRARRRRSWTGLVHGRRRGGRGRRLERPREVRLQGHHGRARERVGTHEQRVGTYERVGTYSLKKNNRKEKYQFLHVGFFTYTSICR